MVIYLLLYCEKNEIKQKEAEIENMSDKVWLDNMSIHKYENLVNSVENLPK